MMPNTAGKSRRSRRSRISRRSRSRRSRRSRMRRANATMRRVKLAMKIAKEIIIQASSLNPNVPKKSSL